MSRDKDCERKRSFTNLSNSSISIYVKKYIFPIPHWQFISSTFLLLTLCIYIWIEMPQGLYAGIDGRLYKNLFAMQQQFSMPFVLNGINVLQGMGNQFIPMNVWLHPAYIPFHLFSGDTAALLSAVISLASLILSVYCLAKIWGLGKSSSIITSHLTVLFFFPFQYEYDLGIAYLLNPGVAVIAALVIGLIALISSISNQTSGVQKFSLKILGIFILVAIGILSDPIWFVVNLLFFFPFFLVPFIAGTMRYRLLVLAIFSVIIAGLYILGILQYLSNLFSYTARTYAPSEVIGHTPSAERISSIFLGKSFSLYVFLMMGIFSGAVFGRRLIKALCFTCFTYLLGIFLLGSLYLISETWTLPIPSYAEFAVLPIFLIAAISGWSCLIISLSRSTRSYYQCNSFLSGYINKIEFNRLIRWSRKGKILLVLFVPVAVIFWIVFVKEMRTGIYIEPNGSIEPPRILIEYLNKNIVADGKKFHGYAAVINNSDESIQKVISIQASILNFLWKNNIPTINEYSQLITPFSHYFFSRTMAGNNFGTTNGIPLAVAKENLLLMLGVSSIISDIPLDLKEFSLANKIYEKGNLHSFYLYIRNKQFQLLNPTIWEYKPSLKELYERIEKPFDPRRNVLVQEALPSNLVQVQSSELRIVRGGYEISAETNGQSALILPIQYSHCLRASVFSGRVVKIFRANGIQTGVLIDGPTKFRIDLDLSFFSAQCRTSDINDINEATRGLPKRSVSLDNPGSKINLTEAKESIKRVLSDTKLVQRLNQSITSFSSIPEHRFNPTRLSCQPFAAASNTYLYKSDIHGYGLKPPWLQSTQTSTNVIEMSGQFLGFGWGQLGQLSQGMVRRLDIGHNEGLVLFRVQPGSKYKVRITYSIHLPRKIFEDLTISFNGFKSDSISSGQDGDLAWTEYMLNKQRTDDCNGWIELLISTRGNLYRPRNSETQEWSGFYLLLKNISIDRIADLNVK